MRTIVPSLSALRAFEASARHRSFTRAAAELNLTQAAVSQQVKGLEKHLGLALFVRHQGRIDLTDAARAYVADVRHAIDLLSQATEELVHADSDRVLTVNSLATFSFRFLMPRLAGFRALHPDITLRITANASLEEFNRKPYDVAVRLGRGVWPGMRVDPLFDDLVFPVCAPSLMDGPHPLSRPSDLSHHVLIRSGFSFLIADAWPTWLKAAGLDTMVPRHDLAFEYAFAALEAASQGLGVALGRLPFVVREIEGGQLVKPFDIEVATGRSYYLVSPLEVANRPKVRAFRDWLLGQWVERD